MRVFLPVACALAALLASILAEAAGTRLLRFPDICGNRIAFSYAGDLWSVDARGGTAVRLTSNPGLELFPKFAPDGRTLAFTAQYGGDEQVYVMPSGGGSPKQLTFYPAQGPLPERWGYDNQVYGWTPDGTAVLFRSTRDGYMLTDARLYTVPSTGGAAVPLPMPTSGAGHFSPDGKQLVYSPLWRDFRSEKRYQGGWANDLYIFDLAHPALTPVTQDPHTDRDPMWIKDAIYFNSDRTGVFNLFRYDIATQVTTQLTHNSTWDVRWPSADAQGQIVYELDGELHVYDTVTAADRALTIQVPADETTRHRQSIDAAESLEDQAISPRGERLAVVARGDIFTVPIAHGVTRNLTATSDAHEREVAWSTDGKQLAYISDRSGEEEVYIQAQQGAMPATPVTAHSTARYYTPRWSGDDKRIAFADQTGTLQVVELAAKQRVTIAKDPGELALDYQWSPDGQYLAYTLNDANGFPGVHVWSVADGRSRRVTPELFNASSPAWAPNGEVLYFLSARDYQPQMSTIEFDFATNRRMGIFAVTLRKDVKNPFGIRNDEPGDADMEDGKATTAPGHEAQSGDKDAAQVHDRRGHGKHVQLKRQATAKLKIDFDGIVQRALRVPLEADNLSNLQAGDDSLVYQLNGAPFYGREPQRKPVVMAYSLKDREAKPVIQDVTDWSMTADGKHVLAQLVSKEIKYVEVGGKEEEAKTVSLAGLVTTHVPAVEWREIFVEVWRRYRDYFYVANMHGFDWPALRRRYEPLLADVGSRADLNYLIAEMIAELTVQHAYIEGGDLDLPKRPFVALPGARFELDARSGRYRIARIFEGQNEETLYRSPLTEVGVDVHVGDYVLTINGRELGAATDPYELLQTAPNAPTEWRVAATPDGKGARTIRYEPLATETHLAYLAWARNNRSRVERESQGRVGYIHIPDMGEAGIREFIKWWYPQVDKEGLIVDVRDNGGGNISAMLIQRLATGLHGTGFARNEELTLTYPRVVQPGPKLALINEDTGSDGDIFAHAFRQWHIGPLIGKRTWGGVVGITEHGPLLDGGTVFVPEFGTADENGRWIIEGHGVDPDIVVEQDPVAVMQGHDPQLERGIQEIMKSLPATPVGLPSRPAAPIKTEMH